MYSAFLSNLWANFLPLCILRLNCFSKPVHGIKCKYTVESYCCSQIFSSFSKFSHFFSFAYDII
jgi:hypothetical protein